MKSYLVELLIECDSEAKADEVYQILLDQCTVRGWPGPIISEEEAEDLR